MVKIRKILKKMKFIVTSLIVVTLSLIFMGGKSETKSNTMDIIQSILVDPEFLALNARQQLHLLIIIHQVLESHYKTKNARKREILSPNHLLFN